MDGERLLTTITIPATLDAANRKKDRSVSLRLTSMFEMTTTDFSEIDKLHGSTGWLLFSPEELTEEHIPTQPLPDEGTRKTPSQRLRASLFVLWEMTNPGEDFDAFYRRRMERIIEHVKQEFPE